MASSPHTSWQIEGEKVEVVTDFLFLGSKITADGDCSHEIRWLLLGRKAMTNLEKQRYYFANEGPHSQGCGLPSESWTVKKPEHQRIDAFELWCWRRLLKVPLTARRSNQSILKEISPEYSLEGLMLKLKLQYFGHLMQVQFSSVQFSCSVVSDSLRPHESQHTSLPVHHQLLEFTQTHVHRVSRLMLRTILWPQGL